MLNDDDNFRLKGLLDAAPVAFGKHLSCLRKIKGWSQERLALEAGMARSYLGGVERGQRNPSLKNLVKLAECMQISLPMLMNFRVDPNSQISQLHTLLQETAIPRQAGCFNTTQTINDPAGPDRARTPVASAHEADSPYETQTTKED